MRGRNGLATCALTAILSLVASGQVIWEFNFDTMDPGNIPSGWSQTVIAGASGDVKWQVVRLSQLWGEPSTLQNFPSTPNALYFGVVDPTKGTGSYRDGSKRVGYVLETSWITMPSPRPNHIRISFVHLREVEYYGTGSQEYDITEVLYRFVNSPETTIKRWSSKDSSGKVWVKFESDAIEVPDSADLALKFKFDSVDGNYNSYFGWLIDNLVVEVYPLTISTVGLPEGTVGSSYSVTLQAIGGIGNYTWSIASGHDLPPRLVLNPATGAITGVPEVPGDYYVVFEVRDQKGNASQKGLQIKIHPANQTGFTIFSEENFASGWQRNPDQQTNLWRVVSICGDAGAYFGKEASSYPSNYHINQRAHGYFVSPAIDVSQYQGVNLEIRFDYRFKVENYKAAHVDKASVEIQFDNGPWHLVWYRDSTQTSEWPLCSQSPSAAIITKYFDSESQDIVVPDGAQWMRIRFGFDTVDQYANNHEGWFVHNLAVRAVQPELQIVTTRLPPVYIGIPYYAKLEARGGKPPYLWTIAGRLPDGLQLDRTTGEIRGTVTDRTVARREPYVFEFKVTDANGTEVKKKLSLEISTEIEVLFADSFDNGFDKWLITDRGLWRFTDIVKGVPLAGRGFIAYYGQNETTNPNYNTGTRTVGYLTSEPFDIPSGVAFFKLEFDYWREVEFYAPGGYDRTYVQIRFLNKDGNPLGDWETKWHIDSATKSTKAWEKGSFCGSIPPGATKMQIRFVFDSVDRFYNNYVGWLIDNVRVEKATSCSPQPFASVSVLTKPRGDFAVFNVPNPVRDVHTTTFVVRGVEADLVKVEVYDLTGRLVYVGQALGNELVWHTQDLLGRYLANGVYLYKVYVKVGDTWIVSDTQKIVILR